MIKPNGKSPPAVPPAANLPLRKPPVPPVVAGLAGKSAPMPAISLQPRMAAPKAPVMQLPRGPLLLNTGPKPVNIATANAVPVQRAATKLELIANSLTTRQLVRDFTHPHRWSINPGQRWATWRLETLNRAYKNAGAHALYRHGSQHTDYNLYRRTVKNAKMIDYRHGTTIPKAKKSSGFITPMWMEYCRNIGRRYTDTTYGNLLPGGKTKFRWPTTQPNGKVTTVKFTIQFEDSETGGLFENGSPNRIQCDSATYTVKMDAKGNAWLVQFFPSRASNTNPSQHTVASAKIPWFNTDGEL
jgi:hypothetical protein